MNTLQKMKAIIMKNKWEILCVFLVTSVVVVAHAWNMFHFPYYESDEGTYTAQAWSVLKHGTLAPYTYWYDHAPAGWLLIALWAKITGGFFTFGFSVNSGRVLMLLLKLVSALMLYGIAKRLFQSKTAAYFAVLFFGLSPLAIYFQRRVLLDNIMVFWLLLSLFLLLHYRNKLRYIIFSALAFGIALLSKETAVVFIPVFVYILYTKTDARHRKMAIFKWLVVTACIAAIYFIFATLKGELFPFGSPLGGTQDHVSLLGTLDFQAGRKSPGILSTAGGSFGNAFQVWFREDPILMLAGTIGTVYCLLRGIKNKTARLVGLLSLSMWLFLLRGGEIIEFYVIPLIPFMALAISFTGLEAVAWLRTKVHNTIRIVSLLPYLALIFMLGFMVFYYSAHSRKFYSIYKSDQTTSQVQAVNWLLTQNTGNEFYSIDNYGYTDLHTKNNNNFKNAEYYWKVDKDSDIRDKVLHGDYQNIDMIAMTPQMRQDIFSGGLNIGLQAVQKSAPIKQFNHDGWGVNYLAVQSPHQILASSWNSYKKHFISNGKVTDPQRGGMTTSEAQSYALLRAVWSDDKNTFDTVNQWTKANMQQPNGLLTWKHQPQVPTAERDMGTASDADEDSALALLFASRKWKQPSYATAAQKIMDGIWVNEVAIVQGKPYLSAGNWANGDSAITINPSYLSPATYRIFAKVDKKHNWQGLVDTSYDVLNKCTQNNLDKTVGVLPPAWCSIDKQTLEVRTTTSPQPTGTEYSYDALRVPFRIALDYRWNKDPRAKTYLTSLVILDQKWNNDKKLINAYQHDGSEWENYESVTAYSGDIGYFMVTNPRTADQIYNTKIVKKFYQDANSAYWEDPNNYYTQNWAWLGTALYTNNTPNLWK